MRFFSATALVLGLLSLVSTGGSTGVNAEQTLCSLDDFIPTYGECDLGHFKRKISWKRNPNATWCDNPRAGTTLPGMPADDWVSCTCRPEELIPVASPPAGEACSESGDGSDKMNVVDYVKKSGSTCVFSKGNVNEFPKGKALCPCTDVHRGATYTECDARGLQESFSFWKKPCSPNSQTGEGAGASSESLGVLPCEMSCAPGEYLAPPLTGCTKCPAGTFSHKGEEFRPPYLGKGLPHRDFVSYCYYSFYDYTLGRSVTKKCHGFKPSADHGSLQAGPYSGQHNLQSFLLYTAHFKEHPATISFDYHISSEQDGDYLLVWANSMLIHQDSGESKGWRTMNVNLPDSLHSCAWTLDSHCLHTNQLEPYTPNSFFHYDISAATEEKEGGSGTLEKVITVLNIQKSIPNSASEKSECALIPPTPSAKGKYLLVPVTDACGTKDLIEHALRSHAAGVLIWNISKSNNQGTNYIRGQSSILSYGLHVAQLGKQAGHKMTEALQIKTQQQFAVRKTPHNSYTVEFSIQYSKDKYWEAGDDFLMVRNLKFHGLKKHATQCEQCPVGYGSEAGSLTCRKCPPNTFADKPGTPYPCTPCPAGISPMGSTKCFSELPCTLNDYTPIFSPCQLDTSKSGGQQQAFRMLSYALTGTTFCDASKFKPPAPSRVNCSICEAGSYRDGAHCVKCKDGEIPNPIPGRKECVNCKHASMKMVPLRELSYKDFDQWNGTFPGTSSAVMSDDDDDENRENGGDTTDEDEARGGNNDSDDEEVATVEERKAKFAPGWARRCSHCLSDGFVLAVRSANVHRSSTHSTEAEFLDSGTVLRVGGPGGQVLEGGVATLTLGVETVQPAPIRFQFAVDYAHSEALQNVHISFTVIDFESNNTLVEMQFNPTLHFGKPKELTKYESLPWDVPAGKKILTWTFKRRYNGKGSADPASFVLNSLSVGGVKDGGSDLCRPCPAGSYCPGEELDPYPCPPGTFSNKDGLDKCSSCGSLNGGASGLGLMKQPLYGQTTCEWCPLSRPANKAQTACTLANECIWKPTWEEAVLRGEAQHYIEKVHPKDPLTGNQISFRPRSVNTPRPITTYEFDLRNWKNVRYTSINSNQHGAKGGETELDLFFTLCDVLPTEIDNPKVKNGNCGRVLTKRHPIPQPSYACVQTNEGKVSHPLGEKLNLSIIFDDERKLEAKGVRAEISSESEMCYANPQKPYVTGLELLCDPTVLGTEYVEGTHHGSCTYNLTMKSVYACPICNNFSFVRVESQCDSNGYKEISYHYADAYGTPLSSPNCFGGVPLPKKETHVKCPFTIVFQGEGASKTWIGLSILLIIVLLILLFGCYQWFKHRELYEKYSKIQSGPGGGGGEMAPVDYIGERGDDDFTVEGHNSPTPRAAAYRGGNEDGEDRPPVPQRGNAEDMPQRSGVDKSAAPNGVTDDTTNDEHQA